MVRDFVRVGVVICVCVAGIAMGSHAPRAAVCEIVDVIDMVEEGLDRGAIRQECDGKVNAGDCSLTRVLRMAENGDLEDEIIDECSGRRQSQDPDLGGSSPRIATFCVTPYGSCPLVVRLLVNEPCYCTGYYGTTWGITQ